MAATVSSSRGGEAKIKPEYLVSTTTTASNELLEPAEKRSRIDNGDTEVDGEKIKLSKRDKKKEKGQNKHRPRTAKFSNNVKLCQHYFDGVPEENCPNEKCPFMHDVEKFWQSKTQKLDRECPIFSQYGKCPRGLVCVFATSHVDPKTFRNLVNEELWSKMKSQYEATHRILLDKNVQQQLRKKKYDFKSIDNIVEGIVFANKQIQGNNVNGKATTTDTDTTIKTSGAVTDEDLVTPRLEEIKKIDWKNKLYLSPLTTVGNLPFRRLCVDYGADITCSEMSLASSILQGNLHEFALHRRHPSEKIWGVQLCANNPWVAAKAAKVLSDIGIDYDFVDLNVGCPLDNIFKQGAGSGLMCRTNKYQSVVKSMASVLRSVGKPFTVKMRTGIKVDKNFAHTLLPFCRDAGVGMVTIHGRTREQRYLKLADWNYIGECAKVADPMPLFGNGDILTWEDYEERKKLSNVTGVVIGRGALMKPWIFQEIKEQRHIDLSSKERLELISKYCNYGLDHWGADGQGVETTRRFLLEWLSFYYRYIPFGILDSPQKVNERPAKYHGRDEMETLLASPNVNDWIKISEMFLGPVPESFDFLPKHKSNAWEGG